ncbi:MAG: SUMF1/EgtB/PvdO family nonheme iron enzyme [Desulfovibrionaceae bacterium]|nr:SUMF1/EgtB/PvdO family nonheme iron enzyme [Desulfovibrionaceae bacterium]
MSKTANLTAEACYNPQPAEQDFLLPMPHGLFLALRIVAVPGSIVNDRTIQLGIHNTAPSRQIYERSFPSHVAASFERQDLPKSWQDKLGTLSNGFAFYFLGKYELSRLQWDVVMTGLNTHGELQPFNLQEHLNPQANLPISHISWFEVQEFLKRYNAWLLNSAHDSIPCYLGTQQMGFLRLPTEEEWEFAARGGLAVAEEDRNHNDSFLKPGQKATDYGVFVDNTTPRNAPLAIGSRKPNPLGLYDTMGNVREMVAGFFRLTIEELDMHNNQRRRLHGAAGGLLCKGGSFRSEPAGVLPGWRDELPLFSSKRVYRAQDLGVRLVLAGLNLPSADRLYQLNQAQAKEPPRPKTHQQKTPQSPPSDSSTPAEQLLSINQHGDLLTELDRISDATQSSVVRANLAQLRTILAERERAIARQQENFLENTMRSTLYQAETIRSYAFRYLQITNILNEQTNSQVSPSETAKAEQLRTSYYHVLLRSANQYKNHLSHIIQANPQAVQQILVQLRQEYNGSEPLDRHMLQNCQNLTKHLDIAAKQGVDALTNEQLCRDIIPTAHLVRMPHFTN